MDEAIGLARRGLYVGTVDEELPRWLNYFRQHDGPERQLSVCSDAHTAGASHAMLHDQFGACVRDGTGTLEEVLPLFTEHPARAFGLARKGVLATGGGRRCTAARSTEPDG